MRYLTPVALLATFTLVFAAFWFWKGPSPDNEDASAELALLSKKGENLTYYARYEGADPKTGATSALTFYRAPRIGFRFDLPDPIGADFDTKTDDDVLKSGDILIVNQALPGRYISCRTERRTCRTAGGLERLGIVTFLTLFRYAPTDDFYLQPHTVRRATPISAAGESGQCFVIEKRELRADETPVADGFIPGEGLPITLCYAADGLPLAGKDNPESGFIQASAIKREVDSSAFEPPFPIVPSTYDGECPNQPTALFCTLSRD